MDKKAKETAISNQISALKVISDNIGFTPDYFPSPKDEKELQLYVHQFVDFIREEKQVEIVTEFSPAYLESDEIGYYTISNPINGRYTEEGMVLYTKSDNTLSPSFLESQIKAIEIVVEKLLEEKDAGTQTGE